MLLIRWSNYLNQIFTDESSGTSYIQIDGENQPKTASSVESMIGALDSIALTNELNGCFGTNATLTATVSCLAPIVHFKDLNDFLAEDLLRAALTHPRPPVVFMRFKEDGPVTELVNNQTLVLGLDYGKEILSHLHIAIEKWNIVNYTFEVSR